MTTRLCALKPAIALILLLILPGCSEVILLPNRSYRFIVTFDWDMELPVILEQIDEAGINIIDRLDIIQGISCHLNEEQMQFIKSLPSVRYIESDLELFMLEAKPSEPLLASSASEVIDWGVRRIAAPEAWEIATGRGVRVGVIDTGIATDHPDLQGAVMGGFNAINGGSYEDDNDHGTYVASVLAARRNGTGIVGVAPEALLYSIKALGSDGRGYISDVIEGCQWALDQGIPVVNMSLGSYYDSIAVREAIDAAASRGMSIVAAAGNDGRRGILFPARNDAAICVGASGMGDERIPWSNYGPELKKNGVLAPGDWILAGTRNGKWRRVSGTSIAAPHVTGIFALLIQLRQLERESLRRLVFEGASKTGNPDEFSGYGVANARKTLEAMLRQ
jgi:subtilisin family serine protease